MHIEALSFADLGTLCPTAVNSGWAGSNRAGQPNSDGSVCINGVVLPEYVLDELRRLGLPLAAYNAGELRDAVDACRYDRQLIDDRRGINFRDQLQLTHAERLALQRAGGNGFYDSGEHTMEDQDMRLFG